MKLGPAVAYLYPGIARGWDKGKVHVALQHTIRYTVENLYYIWITLQKISLCNHYDLVRFSDHMWYMRISYNCIQFKDFVWK